MNNTLRSISLGLLMLSCAWAQTSSGTVSGTVRDRTNSVIPGATVTLLNTATNIRSSTTANDSGLYRIPGVPPGNYILTTEAKGMQKYEGNLSVQVSQSVVVDPVLEPAGTTTTVEVKDLTPLVTTDNATVGSTMERTKIEQLPINGRSIVTLVNLLPGLENQRAYGARFGTIEYVLDGAQEQERRWGN